MLLLLLQDKVKLYTSVPSTFAICFSPTEMSMHFSKYKTKQKLFVSIWYISVCSSFQFKLSAELVFRPFQLFFLKKRKGCCFLLLASLEKDNQQQRTKGSSLIKHAWVVIQRSGPTLEMEDMSANRLCFHLNGRKCLFFGSVLWRDEMERLYSVGNF